MLAGKPRVARPRARPPAPAQPRRRRLQRPLEHRLRRRPPRAGRARLRRRQRHGAAARRCSAPPRRWPGTTSSCARSTCSACSSASASSVFWLLARGMLGDAAARPIAHLLFFAMLAVFLGGSGIVHDAAAGHALRARARRSPSPLSLVGGAAAALAPMYPRLLWVAAALRVRAARGADARRGTHSTEPAARARGAGRPRAHALGRRLVRRARRARLRAARATADERRTRHDRRAGSRPSRSRRCDRARASAASAAR